MSTLADSKTIKALALDLDGTVLAPGPILSERTIRAIDACRQKGLTIIIATGRSIEGAEKFREALDLKGPMVYFNGAAVANMPGSKILSAAFLDKKVIEFLVDLSRETNTYFQAFYYHGNGEGGISLMAERETPEHLMYYRHTGILAEITDIKETIKRPEFKGCFKGMFIADPEVLTALRPTVEQKIGTGVYIAQTLQTFLEIMDGKASKGKGLSFIMERLSIKPEEIIAFGDEENDLPMFEAAGFFVAPSNAKENVKAKADCVVGPNTEDGVAAFLEQYFLA